ncbi:hypothetical protein ACJCF9_002299 [Enterobacter cloacae]
MDFISELDEIIILGTQGHIESSILGMDTEAFYEFTETLYLVTRHYFNINPHKNENFSFIANTSLSGGRHPCSSAECRINKILQVASFSALYSDEVYIQNPFEKIIIDGVENVNSMSKQDVIAGIYNYLYLKPLIKRGIIKYALNKVALCQEHGLSLATPLSEELIKKEKELYELLHQELIHKCTVSFDITADGTPFFEIKGPDSFVEHGVMYFHLMEPVGDYIKSLFKKTLPYRFSMKEVAQEQILDLIISPIIEDLSEQEWHTKFYGTSYLCDNQQQIKIATSTTPTIYKVNSTSFNSSIEHYLPTIQSKNLENILKIREKEEESFKVYRDKVNNLIRKSTSWEQKEIAEIFRDQILPEINIIEKKVSDWKKKTKAGIRDKIIIGSGAVSFGLYAGILPNDLSHLLAAVGGGAAIISTAVDYTKTIRGKSEARSNDFYFLWQMKNK